MSELTPSIPDVFEHQLPESVRAPENARFVTLLKHYYDWLTANGQPTEFITNMLNYRDIDMSSGPFKEHMTELLLDSIPSYSEVDKNVMSKHMAEFLKTKGSVGSIETVMRSIYGEDSKVDWYADKLFKPSANEYSRTGVMAVESTAPWTLTEGAEIFQSAPSPARAIIKSCNTILHKGVYVNKLELEDKSVLGEFVPESYVEVLKNNIDRSGVKVELYYAGVSFASNTLEFLATKEENRPYNNLVVKQIGSNFRAVISTFVSRHQETNRSRVIVTTSSSTGTFVPNADLYIFPSTVESVIYTKDDLQVGYVSDLVSDIVIDSVGGGYRSGDRILFINNDLEPANRVEGYVAEVTKGKIESVEIIDKGYGYSVGDAIITDNRETHGQEAAFEVSSIDGIEGEIALTTELNSIQIVDGGLGYKVGDRFEIAGGEVITGTPRAVVEVATVDSSWAFKGIRIDNTGLSYSPYTKITLVNSSTLAVIAGFTATPTFNQNGGISAITVTATPTITTNALMVIANGYGATANATVATGSITAITPVLNGINYADPVVTIVGDGKDATARAVMTGSTITSYVITNAGTGYTTATVSIKERYGYGFAATPLIQDQTNSSGAVSTLTIVSRGEYSTVPDCFNAEVNNTLGSGTGLRLNYDFRILNTSIVDHGKFYHSVATAVSGKGSGLSGLQVIDDGVIQSVNKVSGGSGYTFAYVTINGGTDFIGTCNIVGNAVNSITVVKGGKKYSSASTVTIVGDGVGASYNLLGVGNIFDGVLSVNVVDGGSNYYHGTTISCIAASGGAVSATLTPVIVDGKIKSITSTGGKGYVPSDLSSFTVNAGISAVLTTTLASTSSIVDYISVDGGFGYYAVGEITPLSITTGVAGTGAKFRATLDVNGGIVAVTVLNSGTGYTSASTISATGTGTGAILKLVVYNGTVTDVIVLNKGSGYKYGTSASIIGDGTGAEITPIVETGLTSADVVSTGSNYAITTTVNVLGGGSGAIVRPVIVSGNIISLTIVNKGTGYTNPTLTLSNVGSGAGAVLSAEATRHISSLQIVNGGTGYTAANINILGDGSSAKFELITEYSGSIGTSTVALKGTGYTQTPTVSVSDNSAYGAISGVKILSEGTGYEVVPKLVVPFKYDVDDNIIAAGAKIVCFGKNIGGIRKVSFDSNGAHFDIIPRPVFNLNAILTTNVPFVVGEQVRLFDGQYKNVAEDYILLEDGTRLISETDDPMILNKSLSMYDQSPFGRVLNYDFDRNTIHMDMISDVFSVTDEQGNLLISEDEVEVVDQASGTFEIGDTIIGMNSGAKSTIKYLNRASGDAVIGGNAFKNYKYKNEVGKLNSAGSVLADNHRYQDYAYAIKSSLALDLYESTLKNLVHPAGYTMFGTVDCFSSAVSGMLDEIGYNRTVTIIYLISLSTDYQVWDGLTEMKFLFSERNKFQLEHMPISYVSDLHEKYTSEALAYEIQDYVTAPITNIKLSSWDATALYSTQIAYNVGTAPDFSSNMTRLTDTTYDSVVGFTKTVSCTSGDTILMEMYVKKTVAPITYPRITMGSSIIDLNTETGFYNAPVGMVVDVINTTDYIFLRLKEVASASTMPLSIYPSIGAVSTFGSIDMTVSGSVEVSDIVIKNITGVSPIDKRVYIANSLYIPTMFETQSTETQTTDVSWVGAYNPVSYVLNRPIHS